MRINLNKTVKVVALTLLCGVTLATAPAADPARGVRNAVHEQAPTQFDCVIEPSEVVDVGSAVAGVIEQIDFDRSDTVSRGDLIARLESGLEQASLNLARERSKLTTAIEIREANAGFVERNQSRSRMLFKESAISGRDMDQLETERRLAELQVRQEKDNQRLAGLELRRAREALDRRRIRSPIDGVVVERYKSVGEYVEDTPVMRIAQLDPLHIETIVPAEMIHDVAVGMQATVTPIVAGEEPYVARVSRIDRVADAATGTFGVRLVLDNPDYSIPSGLRCQLAFRAGSVPAVAAEAAPAKPKPEVAQPKAVAAKPKPVAAEPNVAPRKAASGKPAPKSRATATKAASVSAAVPVVTGAQCYRVGPVSSEERLEELDRALSGAGSLVAASQSAQGVSGDMLVLATRRGAVAEMRALAEKIKSEGVSDTYVLPRGPHKGRLSLGLFRDKAMAERYRSRIARAGYEAEVVPRSPSKTLYWAELKVENGGPSKRDLERLVSDAVPSAGVTLHSCKSLAASR